MSRPVRVLAVARWPVGGIRTYLRYVYSRFERSSFEFTVVTPDLPEVRVLEDEMRDCPVRFTPARDASGLRFQLAALRQAAFGSFDLIHSHGFTAGMTVAPIAKLRGIAHVMTPHEVLTPGQFVGTRGRLRRALLASLLPRLDVIQTISRDAERNLLEYFPQLNGRARFVTIENGIPLERFADATPRDLRAELDLSERHFLMGFLGRFMAPKGFRCLIDAMDLLNREGSLPKDPIVLAVGSGGFVREEQQLIAARKLTSQFRFLPFEPNVAGTLKGLDLMVAPSLWETCPLLPMEAMVAGTPVLGTNCIGLREVLSGTPATVVNAADPQALAAAIRERMQHPQRAEAAAYVPEARRRFDVSRTAERLRNLFETVVHEAA